LRRFAGTVRDVQRGFALVEYAELSVAEESSEKLQEWFPLQQPGDVAAEAAAEAAAEQLPPGAEAHTRRGFLLRPPPPAQVRLLPQLPCLSQDQLWSHRHCRAVLALP
jgi:hypothetical protein